MKYKLYMIRSKPFRMAIFLSLFDSLTSLFIRSIPKEVKSPKKILIIRNDHIGDAVLSTHVYREIKKNFPNSKVTALVSPVTQSIIEKNKNVDEIIPLGLFWREKNFKSFARYMGVFKKLRKEKFDVGIDLRGSLLNSFFLLWMPGVKKRVGYYNFSGGKAFLTNPILYEKIDHFTRTDMELLKKGVGLKKVSSYWPEIITDKADNNEVKNFIRRNNLKKFVCICPCTKNSKAYVTRDRQWPMDRFDRLIKHINSKYEDHKILLVGGPDDCQAINKLAKNKNCVQVINFNLRLLSILFKKSRLVVANDGGPLHIAWVSDANVIALWGVWGTAQLKSIRPLKKTIIIHHLNEAKNTKQLTDLITVDEVKRAVDKVLRQDGA